MLSRIYIQNFALIDQLEINFKKGLQVITGETGAGKSIILGALRLILGYDADTYQMKGGTPWFDKAMQITQNSQNQNYMGWSQLESPRNRGALIATILSEQNSTLRNFYYNYHRMGLDNLGKQDQFSTKQTIANEILKLKFYESNFQMNYPFNLFVESKKDEIYNIFDSNNNGGVDMNQLKNLMSLFSPKDIDTKWNKWK